ncbi:MAG: DegT/DnrJ/EryC1/StrS family aminotransferase [Deltaproteobacteria bacterium]|nr:DegT/DnrJ/EryC1/StrS family aminotransferase [Deltaproteobacteria bacterium]
MPVRIPVAAPVIGEREIEYVTDAVRSGWVSSIGPYVDKFEAAFAAFSGTRHAIAVMNGTTALHVALHAMGVGPGHEVIIPDLTFVGTAHAVLQTGAEVVLVDVDERTWCMDPRAVERALSPRTRAIMPVHLYGLPADMNAILEIASARGLDVIEDCAEAHGATIDGRRVGSMGRIGAFSFYGNKIITTGEGGMLTTSDDGLAARVRFLKDHGMSKERRYLHTELAFNYRMTNLQAALGLAQFEQIEAFIAKKRQILAWYREGLRGVPGIRFNPEQPGMLNVAWMSCLVLDAGRSAQELGAKLSERGIDTRPFFLPMSELPHLAGCRKVSANGPGCPVAGRLSRSGLNLPSGCGLQRAEIDQVCEAVRALV